MSSLVLRSLRRLLLYMERERSVLWEEVSNVTDQLWMASLWGADTSPSSEQTRRLLWHELVRWPYGQDRDSVK
jgi:hypothetical protein